MASALHLSKCLSVSQMINVSEVFNSKCLRFCKSYNSFARSWHSLCQPHAVVHLEWFTNNLEEIPQKWKLSQLDLDQVIGQRQDILCNTPSTPLGQTTLHNLEGC